MINKELDNIIKNNKEIIKKIKALELIYCSNIKQISTLQIENVKLRTKTNELRTRILVARPPKERRLRNDEKERIIISRGNKCEECKETKNLTVHHKKKLAEGGSNEDNNLQVLCVECHRKKHPIQDIQINYGEIVVKNDN